MSIMNGKKGLIMGVANERSIAWGIAKTLSENGAQLAFSYQNEGFKKRLIPLMRTLNSDKYFECDVSKSDSEFNSIDTLFFEKHISSLDSIDIITSLNNLSDRIYIYKNFLDKKSLNL